VVKFRTGPGIACFFLTGVHSGEPVMAWFTARAAVFADRTFTLSPGIVRPVNGLRDCNNSWRRSTYLSL
jgi:uncharacterized membrane protein